MFTRLTIPETLWVGVLCLFAFGSARASHEAATKRERKNEYQAVVARADADFKAAKEACQAKQGDVCAQQANADHVKTTANAKDAMADGRDSTMDAHYKVTKEKCDAQSGDAKDSCIKEAKLKYHQ